MCAHNHSKGDRPTPSMTMSRNHPVANRSHVARRAGRNAAWCRPRKSETPENDEVLAQAVPDSLRHGGRRYVRLWQYDHHRRDWER